MVIFGTTHRRGGCKTGLTKIPQPHALASLTNRAYLETSIEIEDFYLTSRDNSLERMILAGLPERKITQYPVVQRQKNC